ncbi:LINE-1 reverse transcriptase [Plakobranchus ocellatus]|uniref:LINE-1 reverse transcriptase n=1 Tax=Plakobranchus ocellatus TaxID=259542 RepID=A0AAV4BHB9_9GAST|nr:LINE-1 reverse transcriptase [Plakobranchus ocellatus]
MLKSIRPEVSPKQFSFMPDKGTRNAIFTLSMLMERCIEMQKDLDLCFIDYSKAFDKVRHVELFPVLEKLDIDGKDQRVLRYLFWDQTASVRIEEEHSDFKPIKRGVRQGCVS